MIAPLALCAPSRWTKIGSYGYALALGAANGIRYSRRREVGHHPSSSHRALKFGCTDVLVSYPEPLFFSRAAVSLRCKHTKKLAWPGHEDTDTHVVVDSSIKFLVRIGRYS